MTVDHQQNHLPNEPKPALGTVLLVEDNMRVSEELSLVLESSGYTTKCAYDGEHMRAMLSSFTPNIVMLDLNLPSEDGISLCKWLRNVYPHLGIVMLTARVMGSERTEGYQAGADVYLTKPTRPEEILAVIRNLLRRTSGASLINDPALACWTLHLKSMYLVAPEADVLSLTPKETITLKTLAQSSTHCTYEDLIDRLGGETVRSSFDKVRLEVLISRLRSKLFNFKGQAFEIKTVHGSGYRLSTPLKVKSN
jgi:DNA-binding response OmpR family regulator